MVILLLALLFLAFGMWAFISPKSAFAFKAGLVKGLGIKMTAGPKAYKAFRYIGLGIAILGFLILIS